MADLPGHKKEPASKGDIGLGTAAVVGLAAGAIVAAALQGDEEALTGPDVRQQLLTMLKQAGDLRTRGVFTALEHEQLRAVLLTALRRLDALAQQKRPDRHPKDEEVVDAVKVDADPNDADVLDAVDLFFEAKDEDEDVLDAVAVEGDVDDTDVLDALELPEDEGPAADDEDVLDAVDLGDVDDSDAQDANPVEGFEEQDDIADELPLDYADDTQEAAGELDLAGFGDEADGALAGEDYAAEAGVEDTGIDFGGGDEDGGGFQFSFGSGDDSE